jgi:hypothetical protein
MENSNSGTTTGSDAIDPEGTIGKVIKPAHQSRVIQRDNLSSDCIYACEIATLGEVAPGTRQCQIAFGGSTTMLFWDDVINVKYGCR